MNIKSYYRYTKEDVRYVLENFHLKTYKKIAAKLGRSHKAIKHLVRGLGFRKHDGPLTKAKVGAIIKTRFEHLNRPKSELEQYLIANYAKEKSKDIASKFAVKYTRIVYLTGKNKLGLIKRSPDITEDEILYVKENYQKTSIKNLSKEIGRTEASIQLIANRAGICRVPRWTQEEENFVITNYGKIPKQAIGKVLGRSTRSVGHKIGDLQLYKPKPTDIELTFKQLLKSLNVVFLTQVKLWKYRLDFIVDNNIFETYGTYWHCDPRVFKDGPINGIQRQSLECDKRKMTYLSSKGYGVSIIWEKDINENYDKVKQQVVATLTGNS